MALADYRIPFNRPTPVGSELENIRQAIESGQLSGDGPFARKCEAFLQEWFGSPRALLTPSCTHALEMAALLAEVGPGDEVIVPSFAYPSTANAFALRGAALVFADIRPDTLNLDETRLPELMTERTKAVCLVHYAGVGCEMDPIQSACKARNITLIEDNAQGLMGSYRDQKLGTFGETSCLSFHETKNISCGEGGAIIINNPALAQRAEVIRDKGTNRKEFLRGEVQKYTWVDLGSSYLPSELQAAYLHAQFEARGVIQRRRQELWLAYQAGLSEWAEDNGVALPTVPSHCQQPYHIFYLLMPDPASRAGLIDHLAERGILAVFHYQPLHLSDMGRHLGRAPQGCNVTVWASGRIVRLPLYYALTDHEQRRVLEAVRSFEPSPPSP